MAGNLTTEIFNFLKNNSEKRYEVTEIARKIAEQIAKQIGTDNISSVPNSLRERFKEIKGDKIPSDFFSDFRTITSVILAYNAARGRLQRVEGEGLLKYYYTEKTSDAEPPEDSVKDKKKEQRSEQGLYPILSSYLKTQAIGSLRVRESSSRNSPVRGYNRWLHPDLIGVQYLSGNWEPEVKDCAKGSFGSQIKLWSFEVKVELNRGNVRESFFQAVANSSWANFGYLAIEKIDGADRELRMLCNRHGIGVIILNRSKKENDYIHTPARENYDVDWEMVNRLFKVNPDFKEGIKRIYSLYKGGDFDREFWELGDE